MEVAASHWATLAHERIETADVAVVVRFESGALGVLHATTAVTGPERIDQGPVTYDATGEPSAWSAT